MQGRPWGIAVTAAALVCTLAALTRSAGAPTTDAVAHALQALAGAVVWLVAATGAGGALVQRFAPSLLGHDDGLVHAVVWGIGAWGLLCLALLPLGGGGLVGMAACAAVLAAGWLVRPAVRWPELPAAAWLALVAVAMVFAVDALAPPVDTDEIYYHLAIPRNLVAWGAVEGGPLTPNASRPLALHLPWAMIMATAGDSGVRLFNGALACVVLVGTWLVARRCSDRPAVAALACALLVGSWSFVQEGGAAANNLPTALAVLSALLAALGAEASGLAVAAGVALGFKYTAAAPLVGVFLVARLPMRTRVAAGLFALAMIAPWWLRNVLGGLHPLFPFAGWGSDLVFQYLDKYGMGRDLEAFALLPWNVTMRAQPDSFAFLGRLHPAFLLLFPLGLVVAAVQRGPLGRLAIVAALSAAAWAAGPHWIRYLLPALPILAVIAAASLPSGRLPVVGIAMLMLSGLPANWAPLVERTADHLPVAMGHETRDAFLERHVDAWPAVRWANEKLPPDAKVAFLFEWSAYLVERPSVLASVEDHTPARHFLLTYGEASLGELRARGVTHVITSGVAFLDKVYPFVPPDELKRDFHAPKELLDRLLLHEAQLVFQEGRTRIYRLPPEG